MVVVKTANVYDLYVTQSDAMTTDVSVLTNIVLDGSGLTGTGDVRPSQALPHGRPLAVNAHAGETPHVVIMASDGHVACVKQPC